MPVLVDSGFRRGTDIVKALALGAKGVAIGRPYLWGLGAFGQAGVERVLELLRGETASPCSSSAHRRSRTSRRQWCGESDLQPSSRRYGFPGKLDRARSAIQTTKIAAKDRQKNPAVHSKALLAVVMASSLAS